MPDLTLLQMVASAKCVCRKCRTPMAQKDWSSHLICDPPQVWVRWECEKCSYSTTLRFTDAYTFEGETWVEIRFKEAHPDTASGAGKKYVEEGWEELKPQLKAIEEKLHGIKRCPFCDHAAIEIQGLQSIGQFTIWCEGCGATIGGCSSREAAIKAWNERADTKDDSFYNGGNKY